MTSRARLRCNLRNCTWDGILAVPTICTTTPGNLVVTVLLMQYHRLCAAQFGIIAALLAACSVAQLPLMLFGLFLLLAATHPEIRSRNIIRIILTTDFADLLIIEERIFCDFSLSVQSV